MMAQLIDRKHLKQEMKELLRSAQVLSLIHIFPMSMHFGAPCTPLVKAGDHVKVGQKLSLIHI